MNVSQLILHGLGAISIFGEIAGVRILIALFFGLAGFCLLAGAGWIAHLAFAFNISMGSIMAAGILFLAMLQVFIATAVFVLHLLHSRSRVDFIPIRDCHFFVDTIRTLPPSQG